MLTIARSWRQNFCSQSTLLKSLLQKVPKEVQIDVSPGFLSAFFEQTKKAPSYILLKQLFKYLQSKPLHEFPFLQNQQRFQENWMAMHLQLLKARLTEERQRSDAINQMELQRFDYNAQTYFFQDYAKHLHSHMPVFSFASHFSEAYYKRLQLFETAFSDSYEQAPSQQVLLGLLRKLVFEARVGPRDAELIKLGNYYIAHRRYLSLLEWEDLLRYKVKWGLEEDPRLLQALSAS